MAVAPADYPALFRQYAVRSAQVTLDRVRAHEGSFVGAPQEQIFQALDFAMQLDEAWPWVKDVLLTIAPQMVQAGYQDGWAPYLVRGIELAETRGDVRTTAELQLNLGWLLQMRGDFDGADAWYAKSLAAFERFGDDNGAGRALSRQSFVACMCNEYERAQALAEHALSLFAPDDPERAAALNAVGRVAFYRGEFGDAQRAFDPLNTAVGQEHDPVFNVDHVIAVRVFRPIKDTIVIAVTTRIVGIKVVGNMVAVGVTCAFIFGQFAIAVVIIVEVVGDTIIIKIIIGGVAVAVDVFIGG